MEYEIIVVGGGHAGCEAALASARMNKKTLMITMNKNNIADMPCNPSIGGPAKGIVVREISALGGEMANNIDKSFLQMKMLNTKKGPAVRSLRAQADKITYKKEMLKTLENQENLDILEDMVKELLIKDNKIIGVLTENNKEIYSKAVILTTGTYLKSSILVGSSKTSSGPHDEKTCKTLSDDLKKYGFTIKRLKTGTPPRIEKSSIDYSKATIQPGDDTCWNFSVYNELNYETDKQIPCYLIYTTSKTHEIIKENLDKSSMYGGYVEGVGPRYCPSIEDKIVRFSDKERHQLFLEPESIYYDDIYIQGFSTSMPYDVQDKMIRSLPGLENAKILRYAYAIEYDAIYPTQVKPNLETKVLNGLFTAGQINGTSGYEEAACQGLIAGINASLKLENKEPLILKRNEAYIGVLIDDLVTKGTKEPYRMLTSRAEYRLLLRHDNSDLRLREYGHKVGLINGEKYDKFTNKKNNIEELKNKLKETKIKVDNEKRRVTTSVYDYLKNPTSNLKAIIETYNLDLNYDDDVIEEVEIQIKYEGYIKKVEREAEKMLKNSEKQIPEDIDYDKVPNLASEARQKLKEVRPLNIAQAIRISGVNPSDISILLVYLRKQYNE